MITVPDHYVREIDAASRLAVHIINHANSPLIAQCGDLSHDKLRGGFNSSDGRVHVSKDASYVKSLPYPWQAMGPYVLSLDPMTTSYTPTIPQGEQPQSDMSLPPSVAIPVDSKMIPSFRALSPYDIPDLLSYLRGQYDVVYLCGALGLDQKNYDTITDGSFIRAHADNLVILPIGAYSLNILDHHGVFVRSNVLFQGSVFELKVFKYTDRCRLYPFFFKPQHPGVWFNTLDGRAPLGDIVLDTCIHTVLDSSYPANAWLNDAGDIAKIDWEIFRWHTVKYVWHSIDFLQSRNSFASALHFISEAKNHSITVNILDIATGTTLSLPDIIQLARNFNLEIPQNMNTASTFNKEFYNDGYFNR